MYAAGTEGAAIKVGLFTIINRITIHQKVEDGMTPTRAQLVNVWTPFTRRGMKHKDADKQGH